GGACQAVTFADIGRQQFAAVLEYYGAEDAPLGQREPLPGILEHWFVLEQEALERRVEILHRRGPPARGAQVVPRLVGETLDVVGNVARKIHNGRAKPRLRPQPARGEPAFEKCREVVWIDLLESHDGAGL